MAGRVKRENRPLSGVKCVVDTCYYWNNDSCYAESIEVQHPGAETSEHTDCATFTPNNW